MSRTVNKYASLLNQVRSVKHSFNSCLPQDVVLYLNTHNVAPQWQSIDDSVRSQRTKRTTTQILGVNVWRSSRACYPSYNATRCLPWTRYCSCKTAQQGAVRRLYRGLRPLVCVIGIVRFIQIRNHTRGRFIPRARLPEERRISCREGKAMI